MAMFRTEPFTSPLCRISYAFGLHTPRKRDNGTQNYTVTLIFPLDAKSVLQNAVAECVMGEWGDKGVERFKKGLIKNPILDGDGKSAMNKETGELQPGMGSDVVFVRPSSNEPVACFDPKVQPMDGKNIQSGWWGKAVLNCFAWHNTENGDGISFGINMWQHIREDEVLGGGGRGDPADFFKKESVETDDEGSKMSQGAGGMFD